ncbi:Protein CBG08400 [Caenorhabditis briggsae]|uniref:Protein CBG08400 n=1 Tax=Caenorhabditis briggsae TaxID=6238 RepID=A8X6H0_CAEBR|nr:Protein CBG08400 [Caenorhabditis briggsae]CAP28231.2 Protein CBG08400 [Caenorhabditis briggsae]
MNVLFLAGFLDKTKLNRKLVIFPNYSIPYWFGRYHDSFETYSVGSYKDEEHYYACIDHNNYSSGNDPDGHIRFRPLPYPIPKGIDLEYARPRKRGSNSTCMPKHAEGPTISTGVPNCSFSTRLATTKSLIIFTTKNQSETTTIAPEVSPNPPANFNLICTNGFQLVNGKCWKFISQHQSKNNSDLECQKYSGSGLATIQTAQDNLELQNFLKNQNVGRVWIGLECFGNEEEKCEWDNQQGPLTEYSNFGQGFPNWFIGNCTYFDSATGKWISADCDVYEMAYVCELPTTIEDTCEYNYADHCYLRNDAWISFQAALDTCHQQCSEMVSVHSELENRFIQSMYLDVTDQSILWLGGLAAQQDYIMWTDNSPNDYQSDYSAFNNSASCLTMSYRSGSPYSDTVPICNNGFDLNGGNCWKYIPKKLTQADAEKECLKYNGATLLDIRTDTINTALQQYLQNEKVSSPVWLGLYCTQTANLGKCQWSFNRGNTVKVKHFADKNPNVAIGNCVYFDVSSKQWYSEKCTEKMGFLCEVPMTAEDSCVHNYNHNCYFPITSTPHTFAHSHQACQKKYCADLVSIHSELENRYVASLFNHSGDTIIGGMAPTMNTVIWGDRSPAFYNNLKKMGSGNCLHMNVGKIDGTNGQWFSTRCSGSYSFVCKRPTGIKCGTG